MEKIIVILLFVVLATSGCGTRYCNVQDTARTFDILFIQQFNNGVAQTSDNWQGIESYVKNDVATAWPRLSGTAVELYQGAPISGTGERLAGFFAILEKQFNEGIEDTWTNLQWIAKFLCLCKECGLDSNEKGSREDYREPMPEEKNYITPATQSTNYQDASPQQTDYHQPQPQIEPSTQQQNYLRPQPQIKPYQSQ